MNVMKENKRNSLEVVGCLYSTMVAMILTQLLLLHFKTIESVNTIARPGCQESCGGVPIPYPFGISQNCFLSEEFNVTCLIYNNGTSTPYLGQFAILNISLSQGQARISSPISSRCYNSMTKSPLHNSGSYSWPASGIHTTGHVSSKIEQLSDYMSSTMVVDFKYSSFRYNHEKNKFVVIGCKALAYVIFNNHNNSYLGGCVMGCDGLEGLTDGSCSGIGCCQTAIPKRMSTLTVSFDKRFNNSEVHNLIRCSHAMLVEEAAFKFNITYITTEEMLGQRIPMLMDWAIGNTTCDIARRNKSSYACRSDHSVCLNSNTGHGHLCSCYDGYEGNPYLEGGCQDINECVDRNACSKPRKCHNIQGGYRCSCPWGRRSNHNNPFECELNLTLVIGMATVLGFGIAFSIILLYFAIEKRIKLFEKRKQEKLKHKFFVQNRGLVIQQLLASEQDTTQKFRNFRLLELEKATNRFDNALILGRGGHGEVYKGILSDQRVVAIKRSKIVDKTEIDQFINEVVILSQVNHRNVVKLYGCCLETEVPLLVYEFVSNGTLFNHLHVEEHCSLTWKHRLSIALEAAGAISYLHSSASISVFHRDIKSSNILLDDYFTAKVSDFGASRSVQIDQTGVTTAIQGTFGYLDPEYYSTGRLTQKSDVYSFGVILAELLTRQKPLISSSLYEGGSLIAYFRSAMKENHLFEILDPQVVNEGHRTELEAVAKLAEMCLRMEGEERPTMKEVEIRLEVLWRSNQQQIHPWRSQSLVERQFMLLDYNEGIDTETLLSEQSPQNEEIGYTTNCFSIDKEAEESIAIGR